jgi:hypothetical protein
LPHSLHRIDFLHVPLSLESSLDFEKKKFVSARVQQADLSLARLQHQHDPEHSMSRRRCGFGYQTTRRASAHILSDGQLYLPEPFVCMW